MIAVTVTSHGSAIAITITVPVLSIAALVWLATHPEQTEKLAGWVWRGFAHLAGMADRKAVAFSVQGDVNSARAALARTIPTGVMEGKLKLRWAKPEEARTLIREGDVVVFMRKSNHREENLANAVMAYIPKAVVPRARRYVDRDTMRAVDLTVARAVLQASHMPTGALDVFFEHHLDPAIAEGDLRTRLADVDAIDLHGWLTRMLLAEYQLLADTLYPNHPDAHCERDARQFCDWLARLAKREPGSKSALRYQGRYLNVGVMFVAIKGRIETQGIAPYRKRAKRLIYQERCDALYLMARDDNIPAVEELRDSLIGDGRIESVATFDYPLRPDFKARVLRRERAIMVVLRRRRAADQPPMYDAEIEEVGDDEIDVFDAEVETVEAIAATDDHEPESVT